MRLAKKNDKQKVSDIIKHSFDTNPTLLYLIRSKRNKSEYIARIADYAFEFAQRRNGVFISENGKGAAICFRYNYMKNDVRDLLQLAIMLIKACALRRVLAIAYHNYMINKQRPRDGEYLYFWFFGVEPTEQPRISARELAKGVMQMADYQRLDIYAETTLVQNKRIYERFGFEVYHQWHNPLNQITVWFMRRRSTLPSFADRPF